MKKYYHGIIFIAIVICGCRTSSNSHHTADLHLLETTMYNKIIHRQDSINAALKNRLHIDVDERIVIREYFQPQPGDTIPSLKSETIIDHKRSEQNDTDIRQTSVTNTN